MPQRLLSATIWTACTRCVKDSRGPRKKMAPEGSGAKSREEVVRAATRKSCVREAEFAKPQRPKRGRSPLRFAIFALAIKARSMAARMRPNRLEEGERAIAAVLDILGSQVAGRRWPSRRVESDLMYTRCQYNGFVCIAAIWPVQCSMGGCPPVTNKKAARRAAFPTH